MEKFRQLKAELIRSLDGIPTPNEYKQVFLEKFVPGYNALSSHDRYCIECGTRFALADARSKAAKFCSDDCSDRHHMRGKRPANRRKAAAIEAHVASCIDCQRGRECRRFQAIVAGASERKIQAKSRRRE